VVLPLGSRFSFSQQLPVLCFPPQLWSRPDASLWTPLLIYRHAQRRLWITYYTCIFFLLPPRKSRQRFIQCILDRLGCESDIFIRKFGFCSLSSLTTVVSAATFVLCSVGFRQPTATWSMCCI
jgi:hypothetical protein